MKLLRPKRTFIATDTYKKSRLGVDLSLSFGMLDECFSDICSSVAQNLCFDFQCVCVSECVKNSMRPRFTRQIFGIHSITQNTRYIDVCFITLKMVSISKYISSNKLSGYPNIE